jgi:hypothetical protein
VADCSSDEIVKRLDRADYSSGVGNLFSDSLQVDYYGLDSEDAVSVDADIILD